MTENAPEQAPVPTPVPQVKPRSNSELAQLHALYADAKSRAASAAEDLKTITDAIKLKLSESSPGAAKVDLIPANGVDAPALRLNYVESWRVDARKLKAENPEVYVQYAKKSGSWRLDPLKGGDDE